MVIFSKNMFENISLNSQFIRTITKCQSVRNIWGCPKSSQQIATFQRDKLIAFNVEQQHRFQQQRSTDTIYGWHALYSHKLYTLYTQPHTCRQHSLNSLLPYAAATTLSTPTSILCRYALTVLPYQESTYEKKLPTTK